MGNSLFRQAGWMTVKVSARSCRLRFISCGPECIAKGCTARCCDAPTSPTGIRIYVHDSERGPLEKLGASFDGNFLQPKQGCRVCPFKTDDHLCSLFQKPERPFGCIASPFMLNRTGTLVIRNRYKLLPCYDPDRGEPAYRTFRGSLLAIFGESDTIKLTKHLDAGGGDIQLRIDNAIQDKLSSREASLQVQTTPNKAKRRVRAPKD